MNFIGWIRDLFGIQKDMYETKKTRLEIEKIEDERREKLITPATLADVRKYDGNFQKLSQRIDDDVVRYRLSDEVELAEIYFEDLRRRRKRRIIALTLLITALLVISVLIYMLTR